MKTIKLFIFLFLFCLSTLKIQAQDKPAFEGPRWRIGLVIQYASSFKNLSINYPTVGYTGVLGGFTGKGLEVFGGYKIHRYVSIDLGMGVLLNSYNRSFDQYTYVIGRFNKFYIQPGVKFIYPILDKNWGTINLFVGGGLGLNGSGRLYLEEKDYTDRFVSYVKYDPMLAPFATFGAEFLFTDRSNLVAGFKYQNGSFNAKDFHDGYNPAATFKNVPAEFKTINAQGLGIMVGFIQQF